jgi:hypothetical protein
MIEIIDISILWVIGALPSLCAFTFFTLGFFGFFFLALTFATLGFLLLLLGGGFRRLLGGLLLLRSGFGNPATAIPP